MRLSCPMRRARVPCPAVPTPPDRGAESDIKARAAAATGAIGTRAAAVFAVGLVANTILARLLTPADFGIVAIGATIVTAGTFLASGGLGPSLIVRDRAPSADELGATFGLVLAVSVAIAAVAVAI